MLFYTSAVEVNSFSRALCPFQLCLATSLPTLPPSLGKVSGKDVPLFFWCDLAWWLPLTGSSWLPYTHCSCACGSTIQAPSPSSSIVDEFKLKTNKQTTYLIFKFGQRRFSLLKRNKFKQRIRANRLCTYKICHCCRKCLRLITDTASIAFVA